MAHIVRDGNFTFYVHANPVQVPAGWDLQQIVGVAVDSSDRLFLFSRSEHPLTIFDPRGQFLAEWRVCEFVRPHGIFIGPDDCVYCTDDYGHCIRKLSADGKLLMTLGTPGQASDTGVVDCDYRTMRQPSGPFNLPTNIAAAPNDDLYVSDGYGNARIHHFHASGELIS